MRPAGPASCRPSPVPSVAVAEHLRIAGGVGGPRRQEAATLFAKYESILPAPESAHAILGAIEEAKRCKEEGRSETILFGLTGTGFFDMLAYENYQAGNLNDYIPTDGELAVSMDRLPKISGVQE